jgi:hypothetical protein
MAFRFSSFPANHATGFQLVLLIPTCNARRLFQKI